MRRAAWVLALIALAPISAEQVGGQQLSRDLSDVSDGDRVRVSSRIPDAFTGVGTFRGFRGDSLHLEVSPERSEVFAFSDLAGLDVFAGKRRHILAGAGVGLGAGLGTLAMRGSLRCPEDAFCFPMLGDSGFFHRTHGGVLVGAGVVLGAVVGALIRTDRWQAVSWPPHEGHPSAFVKVHERGVALGLSFPFTGPF